MDSTEVRENLFRDTYLKYLLCNKFVSRPYAEFMSNPVLKQNFDRFSGLTRVSKILKYER